MMMMMSKSTKAASDKKPHSLITKESIENIKKGNNALKEEINAEMRLTSLQGSQTGSKIAKLQEKGSYYAKKIELEAKKLQEVEKQIEIYQKSIKAKRARIQREEGNNTETLGKHIKKLEKKLDLTLVRHNQIIADNKQLKEQIDTLRKERVTFDTVFIRLEAELENKKLTLEEVNKNTEIAKDRKKELEEQMKNLRLKVQKDEKDIEKEFQEVFKDITERNVMERIEEKFGTVKDRLPILKDLDVSSPSPHEKMASTGFENSITGNDFSRISMRKTNRSVDKKSKEMHRSPQEEVEEYNAIFESLKKKTNKTELKDILTLFEDYENENYSLYQHLSHLNDEKDSLDKQINKIKDEIAKLSQKEVKEEGEGFRDDKTIKIQDLKREIEESDKHYYFLENKKQGLTETINALKISIPIIFQRIGCSADDHANELLDGAAVNEGNMLQYLSIIEQKTNEILQMYHFSQNRDNLLKINGLEEKGKKVEETNASATFPEKELLADLMGGPEKAEAHTVKDFQDFAKEKVKNFIDKKAKAAK